MVRIACLLVLLPSAAHAWSACGHHLVCLIAYRSLSEAEQQQVAELLTHHPRYEQDFQPPEWVSDRERYPIGYAGEWPDRARELEEFNRPNWHYELGANRVLGKRSAVRVPETLVELPGEATLDTQDLHVLQAIALCRRVLGDASAPPAHRALAISWLGHLVGDLHQPCHAGSLYVGGVFPDGDQGANLILTLQAGNLHAFWDRLLGNQYDEADIRRREREVMNAGPAKLGKRSDRWVRLEPEAWRAESQALAVDYVYTPAVLAHVRAMQSAGR
ncbi:MAG: S1/P1 nuclease, partial [Planctomycetota bacterium]